MKDLVGTFIYNLTPWIIPAVLIASFYLNHSAKTGKGSSGNSGGEAPPSKEEKKPKEEKK